MSDTIFERLAQLPEQVIMRPAALDRAVDSLERALPTDITSPEMPFALEQTGATVIEAAARFSAPRPTVAEATPEAASTGETIDIDKIRAAAQAAASESPEVIIGDGNAQKIA